MTSEIPTLFLLQYLLTPSSLHRPTQATVSSQASIHPLIMIDAYVTILLTSYLG